jgi:hypothetical protein
MARWQTCNVLQVGADTRRVWQFDVRNGNFPLSREESVAAGQPLPSSVVTKTWRALWQRKLNVAWLPPEDVFLRVVHLPKSSLEETASMVELQLEKLSPIPVTQAVWSVHELSTSTEAGTDETQPASNLRAVVVVFAERKAVEEFLGELEGQGYLSDRLEVPALDQLQAATVTEDGAWIFPEAVGGKNTALIAWWYGGVLQNLNLISLPASGDPAIGVKDQLVQFAWAGELEGWLTTPPTWHLVADEAAAAAWEPALRQGLAEPVQVTAPVKPTELAALTAKRAATTETRTNLLPAEYAKRYQLQFQDRLWLRGLAAVVVLYLVGVAVYALALGFKSMRTRSVEKHIAELSDQYTNAIHLKAKYEALKEGQDLKFAALDSWKAVADVLPEAVTLDAINFSDGHSLRLNGTAPSGEDKSVLDFFNQLRKQKVGDQPLFDTDKGDGAPRSGTGPGGVINWNFNLELKRVEMK